MVRNCIRSNRLKIKSVPRIWLEILFKQENEYITQWAPSIWNMNCQLERKNLQFQDFEFVTPNVNLENRRFSIEQFEFTRTFDTHVTEKFQTWDVLCFWLHDAAFRKIYDIEKMAWTTQKYGWKRTPRLSQISVSSRTKVLAALMTYKINTQNKRLVVTHSPAHRPSNCVDVSPSNLTPRLPTYRPNHGVKTVKVFIVHQELFAKASIRLVLIAAFTYDVTREATVHFS